MSVHFLTVVSKPFKYAHPTVAEPAPKCLRTFFLFSRAIGAYGDDILVDVVRVRYVVTILPARVDIGRFMDGAREHVFKAKGVIYVSVWQKTRCNFPEATGAARRALGTAEVRATFTTG